MLTDFQNSFTIILSSKFAVKKVNKYPTIIYTRRYTTLQNVYDKTRKLQYPEKRCHSFYSYISDNFASDFVIFGMLHRNGPSMQVGN